MFARRPKGWIGVDLGSAAVKLAQVQRDGPHWRLLRAQVIRRTFPNRQDEPAPDPLAWWDEVCRSGPVRQGFAGRRAACLLPAAKAELRAMHLPAGSQAERRAMIANELEALSDSEGVRRVFDFWETQPPEGSSLENINVISLAEQEAAAVVGILARAGWICRVIDGLPLALGRAVQMVDRTDGNAPVAALDWGMSSPTFTILCGQRPVFTRHLRDCGFAALPAAVSQSLGLSWDDAEQLLGAHGVCDPAARGDPLSDVQEVLTDITSSLLSQMVSQLNRTLAYPELHRSGLVPSRIWLFGGGATVKNMAALLGARIGLPVRTWGLPGWQSGPNGPPAPLPILAPAIALSCLPLLR